MMRAVVSVLRWIGRACNWLHWAKHYFIFPPNESDEGESRRVKKHRERSVIPAKY